MRTAIEINNLSKGYGDIQALDCITCSVNEGELFGLIGPDGAGKSTLYQILATLLQADSGAAYMHGFDTTTQYRDIRNIIGYMPEKFSLYPDMTVAENLEFFASLFGVRVQDNYSLIAPVFSQLEKFPNRMAGKLSGGMKQKLALSCALIHKPSILLLDEPTTGVDAVSRSEFWDMLKSLRSNGITILVSTSYMDEATLCDRIAMIDHGKILRTGTPDELVSGFGANLYDVAGSDMFKLLSIIREIPEVTNSYTFGATLRIVTTDSFAPSNIENTLRDKGFTDVTIRPAKPTIEDLFIKLAGNNDE